MKAGLILSALLMFIGLLAKSDVTVIAKADLPSLFRSPANFDMQAEQWLYKATGDGNVLLFGGEARGTLYAAYHFLEDVNGVHWWAAWGEETVPSSMAAISGTPALAGIPAFSYRENYSGLGSQNNFFARNRCNGTTTGLGADYGWSETFGAPAFVHTFGYYIPASTYFLTHPEYFALVGGVRNQEQLCMSNNDVYNIILSALTAYIEADRTIAASGGHPMPHYYDLSQNDSLVYCQCPTCAALIQAQGNAPSAPVVDFVNRIARAIKTTYPEVTLTTLAYQKTEKPPASLQVEDNVVIRLTSINNNFAKPFSDSGNASFNSNMQGWSTLAKRLTIWHYQRTFGENYAHNFVTYNLANDLRYSRDHNTEGVFLEHELCPFSAGVTWEFNTWASLKLMENPDLSYDTLLSTFCSGYYGATAGAAILQYMNQISTAAAGNSDYHTWRSTIADYSYINCAFVAAAQQHWAAAEAGATGAQLARVKTARLGFDRYVLHAGQRLIDEYAAAHSGSVANFSTNVINLYQAAQRSITTLNNLPADRFPSALFNSTIINAEIADMNAFSTAFQTIIKSPALPSAIANHAHVILYPGDFLSSCGTAVNRLVIDSSYLPTKLALQADNWSSFSGGIYDFVSGVAAPFATPAVSATQYKWFQLNTLTISPTAYLYLLSASLSSGAYGYKNGITNGSYWGEFRKNTATNRLYVNRIAIVSN